MKTYSELISIPTFEERFEYLKLDGTVGMDTFGSNRIFNQQFYSSTEWRRFRRDIIIRDTGLNDYCCDLACETHPIFNGKILIHHIEPIGMDDLLSNNIGKLMNPENVICVTHGTHNAIHYGDSDLLIGGLVDRKPNDTCPWKI